MRVSPYRHRIAQNSTIPPIESTFPGFLLRWLEAGTGMRGGPAVKGDRLKRSAERDRRYAPESHSDLPLTSASYLQRALRVFASAVLLTIVAAPSLLPKFSVVDNDIWWHLKVGDWM